MTTTTHCLDVPGGRIFFTTAGSGPVLLVAQGGAADADGAAPLALELGDYTVVAWDRRGLSRSVVAPEASLVGLGVHAEDARAILDVVAPDGPAYFFGSSIGALIGLELVSRHPGRVRRIVAHEPPISELLDGARQAELVGLQVALEDTYRRDGAVAAMRAFAAALGVDPSDREPHLPPPVYGPHVAANLERFLSVDAPAVRCHRIDWTALRAAAAKIVVAVGAGSRGTLHAAPAFALAQALETSVVELPGGHGGYATHPRAFAASLRPLLR